MWRWWRNTLSLCTWIYLSESGHLFDVFRVPRAFHVNLRCGAFDVLEIGGRKFDGERADVLVQAMKLCRAGYWNDPGLLGQQPRERDLSRGCLLALRDLAKQID